MSVNYSLIKFCCNCEKLNQDRHWTAYSLDFSKVMDFSLDFVVHLLKLLQTCDLPKPSLL